MPNNPELYTLNQSDEPEQDWELEDAEESCYYCGGEGWGIIGTDWDCHDAINGPYDGETQRCPCCGGSGKAEDCTFW